MRPVRLSVILAIAAAVLSSIACQKTPEPELSVSRNEFNLDARGGYISVSVTTNVKLNVSIQGGWITQDGASDGGSGTYGFKVDFNEGYDSRTGSIIFSNAESGVSQTVTVIQAQQDVIIPGSNEYSLFYEAQTFSLPVSTNVDFNVSVDGGNWIKSLGTRGLSKKEIQFSIAENSGNDPREATITITAGNLKQIIRVEQLATTRKPQTDEELTDSFQMTMEISKQAQEILRDVSKDPVSGWDTKGLADKFSSLAEIVKVVPDQSGKILYAIQRDSTILPVILEYDERNDITDEDIEDEVSAILTRSSLSDDPMRVSPNGPEKKALILSPFQSPLTDGGGMRISENSIRKRLKKIGYKDENIIYFHDKEVNIGHFYGEYLAKFDLIIIATHGGLWDSRAFDFQLEDWSSNLDPYLVYSVGVVDDLSFLDKFSESEKKNLKRYITDQGTYGLSVGKDWFVETTPAGVSFPNSIVLASACHSFELDDFSDFFRSRGASVYYGYEGEVWMGSARMMMNNVMESLTSGLSFSDAKAYLSIDFNWPFKAKSNNKTTLNQVFLVDPRPYDLVSTPWDSKNSVTLVWKTGVTPEECEYIVHVDDKTYSPETERAVTIHNLSEGEHKWYVETAVKRDNKNTFSYKSDGEPFTIAKAAEPEVLDLTTSQANGVTERTAQVSVSIKSNYSPTIVEKGVVYSSTNSQPKVGINNGCETVTSSSTGNSFTVQLTALQPGTKYYARAYVIVDANSTRTAKYGDLISFTTLQEKKPAISVDMSSLVFADTKVGTKSTASFVITNTGSADLTVNLSGAGGVYSMDWTSGTIKPNGGSQKVTVTFTPNIVADFTSTIKISSNAGNDKTISLSGKGISAEEKTAKIEVSKTELKFEDKKQGESATLSFTIRNTGTADLRVSVSDPGAPFSVSWREKTIAPNGRETLSVVFAPNKVADFNVKLQITSNATNGTKYLTLTGKGILDPNTGGDEQKPVISFSSTSLTFSDVMVGETGTQTITVSNTGTKALTIKKITCPSGFSASWSSKTIASKGSEPLTISFSPTSAKTYSGDLVIESDASNGTSKIILLSGTGTAKPEPKLSVSTTDLNFGDQVCFSQESKTLTITNSGTGTLNISSITKTNNYGALFTLSGWTSGGSIAAGASKTITVSFQPIEQRTYEETLTIVSSNATNTKTQTVRLRGTGSPEPENPVINFSVSSLSFGDVEVGESSTKSFTVTNNGTTTLNISSIKITATDNTQNPSYYSITPSDACTIAASKSKSFSVTFSPEAVKNYGATISFKSNATNATQGTSTLNISGAGIQATSKVLTASPSSLSFGMQTVGNRTHKNFTVTNTGTKAVTLYSMEATDGFIVDQTWAEGNSLGLAAGASKTFSAYFAPTQTKAYNGQIVIKSNASNGDLVIPLSGTGAEAQGYIEITSGQTLDFGNVNIGTSGSLSVRIKNSGEASMRILRIDCPDGFSANCNVSSVSAGSNTTVNVFFTPTLAKSYSGTVVIHTDAENETAEIDVSGVGKPTISTETFVDMGVSVKWASKNVGASRPEDYGHYVAWGEVSTKTQYLYNNYKWYVGDAVFSGSGYITKYCTSPEPYGYQGFSNPLKMLAYEDDYAQAKLKGLARTPTRREWEELKKNSDWVWTQENGVNGYLVTSKITGNSIFLPAGGSIEYSNKEVNEVGYYWTSDLNHEESYATTWEIRSNKPWYSSRQRYIGLNVRAVEDETAQPMIYFSAGKLSFVGTKIGTTVSKNLTIKNIGKGTLTISNVSTTKRFSPSWTSATIEPGASKTLTVSYTPVYDPNLVVDDDLTWDYTTLNFTTDARNENSYTIYLMGYGVE